MAVIDTTPENAASLEKLKASYARVFATVQAPENAARFTSKEIATARAVAHISSYKLADWFMTMVDLDNIVRGDKTKIDFIFAAAPEHIENHPQQIDFIAAHEIKHALNFYGDFSGRLMMFLIQQEFKLRQRLLRAKPVMKLGFQLLIPLLSIPYTLLTRHSEYQADNFALRVFPHTDLAAFEEFMQTLRAKIYPDATGWRHHLHHFMADHPTIAERGRALSRAQRRLKIR